MTNDVFSQVPFAAVLVGAIAFVVLWRRHAAPSSASAPTPWTAPRGAWRIAVAAVAAEHLLLLAAPQAVLQWNVDLRRLIVLEAVAVVAGSVCTAAALIALWRQLFSETSDHSSIARTLNLSVASVVIGSGVALAVVYRWASSWSVVTLTPYVLSLSSLHPRVDLVASTPFLVRLHLLGAFACLALLPCTDTFAAIVPRVRRSIGVIAALAARGRPESARLNVAAAGVVGSKAVWSEEER
jgi:nitrate reductase gamma subunit